MQRNRIFASVAGILSPSVASAQGLSWQIVWLLFFAPIFAAVLSVILGAVHRSWKYFLISAGLVVLWAGWFLVASEYTTQDILFWIPAAAVQIQIAVLLGWFGLLIYRRLR